jgi:hypothetical protein
MRKLTKEEWIRRDKEIHGDKDDYCLIVGKLCMEKEKFICLVDEKHGLYEQAFNSRVNNKNKVRCPKCGKIKKAKSKTKPIEDWIRRDKEIHVDKDDYSLVVNGLLCMTKQKFICLVNKNHGVYEQSFNCRVNQKVRCPKCSGQGLSIEEWIKRDKEIHKDKDDYCLVVSGLSCLEKQNFICLINPGHKIYKQSFDNRIRGKQRCPKCSGKNLSIEEWINRDKEIHGNKDDYSLVVAGLPASKKQKFICLVNEEHKIYEQDFGSRINNKSRCPKCANAYNQENIVNEILKEILPQYYFKRNLFYIWIINPITGRSLQLDFYNKELKLAIEVQGKQHYVVSLYNNTQEKLEYQKYRDEIKRIKCSELNIKLIKIPPYSLFKYSKEKLKKYIEKKIRKAL